MPDNDSESKENKTNFEYTFEDLYGNWLLSMTVSTICSILLTYVLFSLLYFTFKRQIHKKKTTNKSNVISATSSKTVLILSFIVCIGTLLHFVTFLPLMGIFFGKPVQEPFCRFYFRFDSVIAGITLLCACFALWFRVYCVFYRHPLIRQTTSRMIRFVSKSTVVYLFLMFVANLVTFITAPPYMTEPVGCRRQQSKGASTLKWSLLTISFVLYQSTLFFLLVYPIYLHRKKMIHAGFHSAKVIPIIKRAFITALVWVLSNVSVSIYGIISTETYNYIRQTFYGSNLVITLIALICFSADWKERLFPCFLNHKIEYETTVYTGERLRQNTNAVNTISDSTAKNSDSTSYSPYRGHKVGVINYGFEKKVNSCNASK